MAGLIWAPDAVNKLNSHPVQYSAAKQPAAAVEASATKYSGTKVCGAPGEVIARDGQQISGSVGERRIFRLSSALGTGFSRSGHGTVWQENGKNWYAPNRNFFGIETLSSDGGKISLFVGPPKGQGLKDLIGTGSKNAAGVRTIGTTIEYFNPGDDAPMMESFHYNSKLAAIEKKDFDHFTPANAMKWTMLGWVDEKRPYEWNYDWSKADKVASEVRARGSKINLHTLIWDTKWGIPQHLWNMHNDGVLNRKKLRQEIHNHIHKVIGRYGDIIDRIDVVNEDIYKEEGGEYLFGRKKYLGDDYIAFSFKETESAIKAYNRKAKTNINPQLMINDYNVLFSLTDSKGDNKSDAYFKRVAGLIKQGVKIDAVGMQAHIRVNEITQALDVNQNGLTGEEIYAGIKSNLKRFSDLGVTLMITELDVEEAWGPSKARGDSDFTVFYEVIGALTHDLPALTDISLWGSSDATMRMVLDNYEDDPGIYDKDYQRKPEYYALLQG